MKSRAQAARRHEERDMAGSWAEKATEILEASAVPYERSFPLARLTTLGVGGPADFLARPDSVPAIAQALEALTNEGIPLAVLGAGSNLLVSEAGFRGVVVCLADLLDEPRIDGNFVRAPAGWRLPSLVSRLTPLGLSGLEWAEGIPGSVGGSVRMNAGAFGDSMQSTVREVAVLDLQGRVERLRVSPADFIYRGAPFLRDSIVVEALFETTPRPPKEIEEIVRPFREHRRRTQPTGVRSSGCIWKNPPGSNAGRLIQEAGLKGTVHGGAKISEVHGNFIVNTGGATFSDVMILAERIRETVLKHAGVSLEMEVVIWP
ncbi:MAG TPA: UDP-N-acetylmuramate dehydrogenase [Candidatus Polarisedimenticolia bacterium]|nr:UDP-N-acetylmuramate dehydrogenase [Candidatus Polarisedimenticolia bacterium]